MAWVYGVMAWSVTEQRHEMAVRIALDATRAQISDVATIAAATAVSGALVPAWSAGAIGPADALRGW